MNSGHIIGISIVNALLCLFVGLMISMMLTGCKCPCAIAGTDTEKIVEIHTHDTTVVTEADSASIQALLRCDSAYNVVLYELTTVNGERIEASAQTQHIGNSMALTLTCHEDSLEQIIQWQDSIIRTTTTTTIVKEVKVRDFVYWCGWVLIGLVVAAAVMGIVMLIIKLK